MTARQAIAAATTTFAVVVAAAIVLAVKTGFATVVVTHGISMQPLYYQGDLVVAVRQQDYRVGDIVTFDHESTDASKTRVLHRIIAVGAEGVTTKGDNNQSIDPGMTSLDKIRGRAVLHVPKVGTLVNAAGTPWGTAALVGGPLLLSLLGGSAAVSSRGSRARRARARRASAGARSPLHELRSRAHTASATSAARGSLAGPAVPRSSSAAITAGVNPVALGVVLVLGAAGLGLGISSWSTPPDKISSVPAGDLVRTASFSYSADVRRSPVYDGTVVTAPMPVFRTVAKGIRADLNYKGARGESGKIDVSAQLSSSGGWTTSMPVVSGYRYGSGAATLHEPLDLDAFLARSEAAAAITGLNPQPLAVVMTATVTPDGVAAASGSAAGGPLATTMALTVTDAQVVLNGEVSALTTTAKEPQTRTVTEPGAVSVVGVDLPVQPVRVAAVVLLVLAALGGLVLALVTALARARADARSTETERVAACLADLLVPVVEIPGADTAVEVISPEALERLARAHELPVLHRRGHGAAVFAVVVEGTTYTWSEHDGEVVSDEGFLLDHVLHHADGAARMPWEEPCGASPSSPFAATTRPDAPEHWRAPDPQAAPAALSPRRAARAALAAQREPDPDEPTFAELLQPDAFSRLVDPDPFARLGPAARGPARRARSGDGVGQRPGQHGSTRRELPPGPSHARR